MVSKSRGKIWSSPIGGESEKARESQSFEQEAQSESQFDNQDCEEALVDIEQTRVSILWRVILKYV